MEDVCPCLRRLPYSSPQNQRLPRDWRQENSFPQMDRGIFRGFHEELPLQNWDHGRFQHGDLLSIVPVSVGIGTNGRYVFFEKMRVFEGKDKTELRLKQENAFRSGRDLQALKRTGLWLRDGEYTEHDELGRRVIIRQGGSRQVLD